jgi:hypothetical protein
MAAHSRVIFSNNTDGSSVARHWIRKTGYMLQKGLEYRLANPHRNQFTDIRYEELRDDSPKILLDIYRNNGGLSEDLRERFARTEQRNPMGKYGIHEYRLEDFGARKEDILEATARYREMIFQELK